MIEPFHANREEEILSRARNGDRAAFGQLCECHRKRIWSIAMSVTRRRDDAEDLAQTAIVRAFQALATFRGETAFEAWLCRIALNAAHDYQRSAWRRRVLLWGQNRPGDTANDGADATAALGPASTSNSAHTEAEHRELQRRVRAAVAALGPNERVPIWLIYFEEFTITEVGRLENVPESTIRSRVKVGLRKLERALGDLDLPNIKSRGEAPTDPQASAPSTILTNRGRASEMRGSTT